MSTSYSTQLIKSDGDIPNNNKLPVIIYTDVFDFKKDHHAESIKKIFSQNGWFRSWTDSIYEFNHYHSNNHECLGIALGWVKVILGGNNGYIFDLKAGDALLLPAGVSHRKIASSKDFVCVGAYSIDVEYNMNYCKKSELEAAEKKIGSLPTPMTDPIFGAKGPSTKEWK